MPLSDTAVAWTPITVARPPEGVIVDTTTSERRRLRVKWEGRIWRLPGVAHYPCFTPAYRRPELPTASPPVR